MTATGAVFLQDHLTSLARDLAGRQVVDEHPCGSLTARFRGPRHPAREQVPRRWVHAHGLTFDTVGLAMAGAAKGPGTVHIGTRTVAARRGPLAWSVHDEPPVLAGTTPGREIPTLWLYHPDQDEVVRLPEVVVNHSLLESSPPLLWTASGALVVLADDDTTSAGVADRVHDSAGELSVLDDPEGLLTAAGVTVRTVRANGEQTVIAGPHAVCRLELSPDGRRLLVGAVRDAAALTRLARDRRAELTVHDLTGVEPPRSLGECAVDRPFGEPNGAAPGSGGLTARRASTHRQLSPDVALHGDEGPVVLWLNPRPDVADRGRFPPYAGAGADPPGPLWTYRPRCSVAMVRLWHPRQNGPATFAEVAARVVEGIRDAAELVQRELGDTPLVLGAHSFGAALAAVALPELGSVVRCAVLRSGAYNRTLTPGGFQLEHRPIWAVPDMYHGFTTVHAVHRITVPTLLLQGTADPNVSTTVCQAQTFYEALRIAGVPARLVLLDAEGHHFSTADGILCAAREENEWIDRWCPDRRM